MTNGEPPTASSDWNVGSEVARPSCVILSEAFGAREGSRRLACRDRLVAAWMPEFARRIGCAWQFRLSRSFALRPLAAAQDDTKERASFAGAHDDQKESAYAGDRDELKKGNFMSCEDDKWRAANGII